MRATFEALRYSGAGLFFIVAAGLAVLAGAMVHAYMNSAVQTETVLVVTREIPAGTTITAQDVAAKAIPAGGAPAAAARERSQVVGQRARVGLVAGAVVQADHLVRGGSDLASKVAAMGEDYRMIMLPADLVPAAERLVAGDRLELTGLFPVADQKASTLVTIPLGTATVLDAPQGARGQGEGGRSVVLVAVKAEQASLIALTLRSGSLATALLGHGKDSPPAPSLRVDAVVSSLGARPASQAPPAAGR